MCLKDKGRNPPRCSAWMGEAGVQLFAGKVVVAAWAVLRGPLSPISVPAQTDRR
jgi:hypothetical protein